MKMDFTGIIIGLRPFGERDLIARIFTCEYGVLSGMLRGGAIVRKNKSLVGQVGTGSWNARLDSDLGTFHFEAARNLAAPIMSFASALSQMNAAFALIAALLPERESYRVLYDQTIELLERMGNEYLKYGNIGKDALSGHLFNYSPQRGESQSQRRCGGGQMFNAYLDDIKNIYLGWELALLREMGYALDLTHCSNCGRADNLTHISRRTGRAVCAECAAPWVAQCFTLPVTLDTTKFFITRIITDNGAKMPAARDMIN